MGGGLFNFKDVEPPPDGALAQFELRNLRSHAGDKLHGIADGDSVVERPCAVKLLHQGGHGLLEVLRRVKQSSLEFLLQ